MVAAPVVAVTTTVAATPSTTSSHFGFRVLIEPPFLFATSEREAAAGLAPGAADNPITQAGEPHPPRQLCEPTPKRTARQLPPVDGKHSLRPSPPGGSAICRSRRRDPGARWPPPYNPIQDDLLRDPARARGRPLREDGRVLQGQPERHGDRRPARGARPAAREGRRRHVQADDSRPPPRPSGQVPGHGPA